MCLLPLSLLSSRTPFWRFPFGLSLSITSLSSTASFFQPNTSPSWPWSWSRWLLCPSIGTLEGGPQACCSFLARGDPSAHPSVLPLNTISHHIPVNTTTLSKYPFHQNRWWTHSTSRSRPSDHMNFTLSNYPFTNYLFFYLSINIPTCQNMYSINIGDEHVQHRVPVHLSTSNVGWLQCLWYGISR